MSSSIGTDNLPSSLLYEIYNGGINDLTRNQLGNLSSEERNKFLGACDLVEKDLERIAKADNAVEKFLAFKEKNPMPTERNPIIQKLNISHHTNYVERLGNRFWSTSTTNLEEKFIGIKYRILHFKKAIEAKEQEHALAAQPSIDTQSTPSSSESESPASSQRTTATTTTTTTTTTTPRVLKKEVSIYLEHLSYKINLLGRQLEELKDYNDNGQYDYMFEMLEKLQSIEAQLNGTSPNVKPQEEWGILWKTLCQFEAAHEFTGTTLPEPQYKRKTEQFDDFALVGEGQESLASKARSTMQAAIILLKERFFEAVPQQAPTRPLPKNPKPTRAIPVPDFRGVADDTSSIFQSTTTTTSSKEVNSARLFDLNHKASLLERQLAKLDQYNKNGKYNYMSQMLETLKRIEAEFSESSNIEPIGELEALCKFEVDNQFSGARISAPDAEVEKSLPSDLDQNLREEDLVLRTRAIIQEAIFLLKEDFLVPLPPKPERSLPRIPATPIIIPASNMAALLQGRENDTIEDANVSLPHHNPKPVIQLSPQKLELTRPEASNDLSVYETYFRGWQIRYKDTGHPQAGFVSKFLRYLEEFQEATRGKGGSVQAPDEMRKSLYNLKDSLATVVEFLEEKIKPDSEFDTFVIVDQSRDQSKLEEAIRLNEDIGNAINLLISYL